MSSNARKCCVYFVVALTLILGVILITLGADHSAQCTPESNSSCELHANIFIGCGVGSLVLMVVTLIVYYVNE